MDKPSPMSPFLGRALEQLQETRSKPTTAPTTLPLSALYTQAQPRRRFERIEELAESIRAQGVLQPLLVKPDGDGRRYRVIAGERRLRAAHLAGLTEVPVRILNLTDEEARVVALLENLQREDLNPYEETVGVLELLSEDLAKSRAEVVSLLRRMRKERRGEAGHNVMASPEAQRVEETFKALGRMTWESFVQNRLPLLSLPEDVREALEAGAIPYTAALELKKVKDGAYRAELIRQISEGLSLRELKQLVRRSLLPAQDDTKADWRKDALKTIARANLDQIPEERRPLVEERLRALLEVLTP
jgi:ParB family chromosome partitioning protein